MSIILTGRQCFGGLRSVIINNCVALFLIYSIWEQVTNIAAHLRWTHFHDCDNGFARQPSCGTFGYEAGAYNHRRLKFWTESAFIPFVSFGDLDNNTFKGLTSLLSVKQEIQYDEHTWIVYNDQWTRFNTRSNNQWDNANGYNMVSILVWIYENQTRVWLILAVISRWHSSKVHNIEEIILSMDAQ
jgi:hypothetical protein